MKTTVYTFSMFSERFHRHIRITRHAAARMIERNISESLLLDVIETGTVKHKDNIRFWIFRHYADRTDNLLCAARVLESELIVKTVMHHFSPE